MRCLCLRGANGLTATSSGRAARAPRAVANVVEQAARVPDFRGRARELHRNSLRPFSDPDPVLNDAA